MEAWWYSRLLSVDCFPSSPCAHVGFFWVLWFPFHKHVSRWIGGSKLPLNLNKCVNMCACVFLQWIGIP